MNKNNLSELNNEELLKKYNTFRIIQWIVIAIFLSLLIAWVVFGYWNDNLEAFIIQIVIAVGITLIYQVVLNRYKVEIIKRGKELEQG